MFRKYREDSLDYGDGGRLRNALVASLLFHVVVFFLIVFLANYVGKLVRPLGYEIQFVFARVGGGTDDVEGAPAPESEAAPKPEPTKPEPPKPEPPKPEPPKPKAEPPKPEPPKEEVKKPDIAKPEPPKKTKPPKVEEAKPEKPKDPPKEKTPTKTKETPKDKGKQTQNRNSKNPPKATDSFKNAGDGSGLGTDPNLHGTKAGPAIEGPRGTGIGTDGLPPVLNAWAGLVQRKVEKEWQQPAGIRLDSANKQALVLFWVDRQGNLLGQPEIIRAADDPELGESGVRAIIAAAPLPPLPDGFQGMEQQVVYGFSLEK